MAPDDRELLRAHVEGDPDAFGELVRRHRERLWAVALRTTGDPEEAADALQEALVSAYRRAGTFRGDAAVTTWLHQVVVNACLDRIRARRSRRTEALPDDVERLPSGDGSGRMTGSATEDPVEHVTRDERRRLVLAALDELPLEQRAALVLVDMEGWSVAEAARVLDCREGTVKSRCSRGRRRLAELLRPLLADVDEPPPGAGTARGNPDAPADVGSEDAGNPDARNRDADPHADAPNSPPSANSRTSRNTRGDTRR